ncbi:MAG: DUF5689 domain-containing protein [Flavobacteriaceae bacterium]|nr:DUF5689 domain-containing protein [Flavobacteriaceae bacterium]
MTNYSKYTHNILSLLTSLLVSSCAPKEFIAEADCHPKSSTNTSFDQIFAMAKDSIQKFPENTTINAWVISNDKEDAIYAKLYIQEKPEALGPCIQLLLDNYDLYKIYPQGSNIQIQVGNWNYQKNNKGMRIGLKTDGAYGNTTLAAIPIHEYTQKIKPLCVDFTTIQSNIVSIPNLKDAYLGAYIRVDSVQFEALSIEKPYAHQKEGEHHLWRCQKKTSLGIRCSPYAAFANNPMPQGMGSVAGILEKQANNYYLRPMQSADLDFSKPRCVAPKPMQSQQFFFSELADPNNNNQARFVELYNAGPELRLEGWEIWRYTNANSTPSSKYPLKGTLASKSTLVIAANAKVFESIYGFVPDLEAGKNNVADSNGDDNLVLIDPFGYKVDVFGKIGEDGTNTNHEFEDGRALRLHHIQKASATYIFNQWKIFNDSGKSNTIKNPQNAPEDFNPGIHQ